MAHFAAEAAVSCMRKGAPSSFDGQLLTGPGPRWAGGFRISGGLGSLLSALTRNFQSSSLKCKLSLATRVLPRPVPKFLHRVRLAYRLLLSCFPCAERCCLGHR